LIGFGQKKSRDGWSNYEKTECVKIFQNFKSFADKYSLDGDLLIECMCNEAEVNYASYHEFRKIKFTEALVKKFFSPCGPEVPDYPEANCVEGDCVNGYGKLYLSEGNYYQGNFENGIMHGKGILVIDGVEGKGKFRNGLKHGKFILKDITGIETELKFKEDVIQ
jgi:hypothetical protein